MHTHAHTGVIFSNNRTRAAELVDVLESAGWPARFVAGDLPQAERLEVMASINVDV